MGWIEVAAVAIVAFLLGYAARALRGDGDSLQIRPPSRPAAPSARAATRQLDASVRAELERLLRNNQKIQAIKTYRDATGSGLREAKDAVESLARDRT